MEEEEAAPSWLNEDPTPPDSPVMTERPVSTSSGGIAPPPPAHKPPPPPPKPVSAMKENTANPAWAASSSPTYGSSHSGSQHEQAAASSPSSRVYDEDTGDEEAPDWATSSGGAGGTSSGGAKKTTSQRPTADGDDEESKQMRKYMFYLRVVNITLAFVLTLTAVIVLSGTPSLEIGILAFYMFIFGVLLCCFELSLRAVATTIAENMGFLYTAHGRAGFFFFLAILCFEFGVVSWIGFLSGTIVLIGCMGHLYVYWLYPESAEILRARHLAGAEDPEAADRRRKAKHATAAAFAESV